MQTLDTTSDAQLVTAAIGGDGGAFAAIYDRYADRLYSYCLTMLRDRDDAADATHDAFAKAAQKLDQLEDRAKLRPWLFAIARNESHAQGRRKARVQPTDDLSDALVDDPDLALGAKQDELRELVWAAAEGLGERDQQLMALHLVEGLEGDDLAEAMDVSSSHLHVMVSRMKDRVEKALGALLIARLGNEDCDELAGVLGDWDGSFSMEVRSRVTRHIESCEECQERRAVLLAPANVLPGIMLVPAPAALRDRVLGGLSSKPPIWKQEWVKWVAVAAVALVLTGVGTVVASNLDPIAGSSPGPTIAAAPATSTQEAVPSTSPPASVAVTPTSQGPAVAQEPASLEISDTVIDLGDTEVTAEFELSNLSGTNAEWTLTGPNEVIAADTTAGNLAAGETQVVTVLLDREISEEGELGQEFTLTWNGGEAVVFVQWQHMVNPLIIGPKASPSTVLAQTASVCVPDRTTITVRVTDTSEIERVVVSWDDGSGVVETEMSAVDEENWTAVIGPFPSVVEPKVKIVAWDIHENAGGAPVALNVIGCS